jgi:hypothetical protein
MLIVLECRAKRKGVTVELLMWNTVGKSPQGIPYDGYSRVNISS